MILKSSIIQLQNENATRVFCTKTRAAYCFPSSVRVVSGKLEERAERQSMALYGGGMPGVYRKTNTQESGRSFNS